MSDNIDSIKELREKIQDFISERDWNQFHLPKNLSISVAIEAAELLENFQWLNEEQASLKNLTNKNVENINDEIADIAIYLLSLCNVLNIDLSDSINAKLIKNKKKYPVELSKGSSKKYTKFINN